MLRYVPIDVHVSNQLRAKGVDEDQIMWPKPVASPALLPPERKVYFERSSNGALPLIVIREPTRTVVV